MKAEHTLKQVSEHVFWYTPFSTTDRPALALVVGERYSMMLDAGNSVAHVQQFLSATKHLNLPKPDFCVITHAHWDHFFGAHALQIPLIAHRQTADAIAIQARYEWNDAALDARVDAGIEIEFCRDMIKLELPDRRGMKLRVPDMVFTNEMMIDLGGIECQIMHVGGDHAGDSSVVFVPQDKLLFLGDCLYPAIYTPERYYRMNTTLKLVDKLASFEATTCIFGHDDNIFDAQAWANDQRNFREVAQMVQTHGADVPSIEKAIQSSTLPDHEWALELATLYLQGEKI